MPTRLLVERSIGAGRVVFVSTGLLSEWSTLPKTNTMFLFDRLLRSMIQATLPTRNFDPTARLTLPLGAVDPRQAVRFSDLTMPARTNRSTWDSSDAISGA